MARAIEVNGISIVNDITVQCNKLDEIGQVACEHGIGHGLVGHGGYTITSLDQVLPICDKLEPGARINGCETGVFMEYSFRNLLLYDTQGKQGMVKLTETNVYGPCNDIGVTFRPTCVWELPNWWAVTNPQLTADQQIALSGGWCEKIDGKPDGLSGACFEGIGSAYTASLNLDIPKVISACDLATKSASYRLRCLAASAYALRAAGKTDYAASCGQFGLSGSSLTYCQNYASSHPQQRGSQLIPKDL